ncbi:MAG: hypothetical protein WDW38_009961 [Sanguina aurantia]
MPLVVVFDAGIGQRWQGGKRVPAESLVVGQKTDHGFGVHCQWRMSREQFFFLLAAPAPHDVPARRQQHDEGVEFAPQRLVATQLLVDPVAPDAVRIFFALEVIDRGREGMVCCTG